MTLVPAGLAHDHKTREESYVGLLVTCQCPLTADKKGKLGRAIYTVSGLSWLSLSTSRRNGLEVGGLVGAISPQLLTLLSSLVVMG